MICGSKIDEMEEKNTYDSSYNSSFASSFKDSSYMNSFNSNSVKSSWGSYSSMSSAAPNNRQPSMYRQPKDMYSQPKQEKWSAPVAQAPYNSFTPRSQPIPINANAAMQKKAFQTRVQEVQEHLQDMTIKQKSPAKKRHLDNEKMAALQEDPLYNRRLQQDFLHIQAMVNGKRTEILIDTGAQHSVMSTAWMKKTDLAHLLDKRERGTCVGVGSAEIHGKVWRVPINLNMQRFNITVNVMDMDPEESPLILGLDFLTKYKCNVNVVARQLEFPRFTVKCSSKEMNRVWK